MAGNSYNFFLSIFLPKVSKRLLLLKKLDGYPIIREEDDNEEEEAVGGDSDSSDLEEFNQ